MSGGGTETAVAGEAAQGGGGGGRKRDSLGTPGAAHLVIKDLGEIHSRLLDHRPVTQGEIRYFVKEFEEKRGLRELRVLENLKNMIEETNERMLPKCRETMQDGLEETLQKLQAAKDSICKLQQREQEREKNVLFGRAICFKATTKEKQTKQTATTGHCLITVPETMVPSASTQSEM
ncbi:biogenesis of lysosome-related organelles complex 1 subunit 5 isoform X2 [Alexandromys fortis]|uniref:biogenesis of lysosome-related organelles complex 1 subunit 5 isoform X2 n=1 Tax=Alexandromys fortis TaxID=100897 RepID=UPI002152DF70|nr:biogenesis of lysosome-related organelles complex 1 subunit 5 isoform X2 [Microtus fortis]